MIRIRFLSAVFFVLVIASSLFAQDTKFPPEDEQIPGPDVGEVYVGAWKCCYHSDEMKDPAQAFKTWIEDVSIGGASA